MPSTTIYKIGGSLLELPDLAMRIRGLLRTRDDTRPLLVIGGGPTADLVRAWDRIHTLGDEAAHWLAIDSLRLNEQLAERLLPEAEIVADRVAANDAWRRERVPLLCTADFLRAEDGAPELPRNWSVTSDSIAAWVALRWPADELVLVKSTDAHGGLREVDAREPPLVDGYFLQLAGALPRLGWVNLRGANPAIVSVDAGFRAGARSP